MIRYTQIIYHRTDKKFTQTPRYYLAYFHPDSYFPVGGCKQGTSDLDPETVHIAVVPCSGCNLDLVESFLDLEHLVQSSVPHTAVD